MTHRPKITFIGAGHETTARALGWTLYLLSRAPHERAIVEDEIDHVLNSDPEPVKWLELIPKTRAVFEEAMRLYVAEQISALLPYRINVAAGDSLLHKTMSAAQH